MAVTSVEQATVVLRSISLLNNLEAAREYGQAILDAVKLVEENDL